MTCQACKGRGKINFGMTTCPKCNGKGEDTPPPPKKEPRKDTSRAGNIIVEVSLSGYDNLTEDEKQILKDAFGSFLGTKHTFTDGVCDCGDPHTPDELRSWLQAQADKLVKANPELGKKLITVPINVTTGTLSQAYDQAIEVLKELDADGGNKFTLSSFSAMCEDLYAAWLKDFGVPKDIYLPDLSDDKAKTAAIAGESIILLTASLWLKYTDPAQCSPLLQGHLAYLAKKILLSPELLPGGLGGGS